MTWQPMRVPGKIFENGLPSDRGRYLLRLSPPYVEGDSHFVHFSWKDESFCIRDYMLQLERRQSPDVTATSVWQAASERIPATGELYVPVENYEFWTAKLTALTQDSKVRWSQLSSKFTVQRSSVPEFENESGISPDIKMDDENDDGNIYRKFIRLWRSVPGFEVIERTVGCSARYSHEPLLWVYPTYFQIAPEGKGNAHWRDVKRLRDSHFPEMASKGMIGFRSTYFSWERLHNLVDDLRHMVKRH